MRNFAIEPAVSYLSQLLRNPRPPSLLVGCQFQAFQTVCDELIALNQFCVANFLGKRTKNMAISKTWLGVLVRTWKRYEHSVSALYDVKRGHFCFSAHFPKRGARHKK